MEERNKPWRYSPPVKCFHSLSCGWLPPLCCSLLHLEHSVPYTSLDHGLVVSDLDLPSFFRPLYSYPCFSWAVCSLWVITIGPVTILLNGWGFMFLTWGWTRKWITSLYWPSGWIISAFLWWYACFQWLEMQPPSRARGWYLHGLGSVARSGAGATPT